MRAGDFLVVLGRAATLRELEAAAAATARRLSRDGT